MPPASIHDLALETLQHIFTYACADEGSAGYTLALVSKYFNQAVHPIRVRTVALYDVVQIESFAAFLTTSVQRPRVHHLFVSTWQDGARVVQTRTGDLSRQEEDYEMYPIEAYEEEVNWADWTTLRKDLNEKLSVFLPRVLQFVATDLRSLSIVHSWELSPIAYPTCFPSLEELTVFGPLPRLPEVAVSSPCFPTVRALHIGCPSVALAHWIHHTPAVTRLRLSELSPDANSLPEELAVITGTGRTAGTVAHGVQSRPQLKLIRLQIRNISRQGLCTSFVILYNLYALKICMTTRRCRRVKVLGTRQYRPGFWDSRVKRDWLGRIHGGAGCWSTEERDEA
ncbi:hypothetical protein C8Q73DRAFT_663193 [Cubamyces lactineus]|nr:hypothetical protein C8Q73DRAFT_663193 [Cubamyces lactineus]